MTADARPLVTALVVTYNQRDFVEEALASVLAQTYRPLQVVVSDDCSTDGTFEKTVEFVKSRNRLDVEVTQTACNRGLGANLNHALARARGEIIVVFAGDDVSLPQRCSELAAVFGDASRNVFAATSDVRLCDSAGEIFGYQKGWSRPEPLEAEAFVRPEVSMLGAAAAYRRDVFSHFGPLPEGFNHEDQLLPFRAGLLGDLAWLRMPLLLYRRHDAAMSGPRAEPRLVASEYRRRLQRISRDHLALLRQKAMDLDVARRVDGISPERLDGIGQKLAHSIETITLFLKIFDRPVAAISTLLIQVVRRRRSLRSALRDIAMVLLPDFWQRRSGRRF